MMNYFLSCFSYRVSQFDKKMLEKKICFNFICTRIYLFGKVKIDWDIFLLLFQLTEETLWSQPTTSVDTAPAGTNQIHKY